MHCIMQIGTAGGDFSKLGKINSAIQTVRLWFVCFCVRLLFGVVSSKSAKTSLEKTFK